MPLVYSISRDADQRKERSQEVVRLAAQPEGFGPTGAHLKREVRVSLLFVRCGGTGSASGAGSAAALAHFRLRLLAVAQDLPDVQPVLLEGRAGRQLEAADQAVRDHGPAAVLLDQVAPHLKVALPHEPRVMVVCGHAGESRLYGQAERSGADTDPVGRAVDG